MRRSGRILAALTLAALYLALPNDRPDFTRFNSHDSESYLALSYSLTHGRGYTRSLPPAAPIAHEMWPPGWPAVLGLATIGAGDRLNWARVKRTVAVLGLLGLVPVWLWLRRIGGEAAADAGTMALALHPLYWHFSHQAMAEVPLVLWLLFGLLWIDRTWSKPELTTASAIGGGLLLGLGMLIKGHAAALLFAPLAYLGPAADGARGHRFVRWALFCMAFLLPFLLWVARNQTIDAPGADGFSQLDQIRVGDPMDPESRARGAAESTSSMLTKLRRHAIYRVPALLVPGLWEEEALDWPGSGWLALPLTALLVAGAWIRGPAARAALLVVAFLTILNLNYGFGGAVRFWLPVALLLLLLVAVRLTRAVAAMPVAMRRIVLSVASVTLIANLAFYIAAHERQPFNPNGPWAELAELFDAVRQRPFATPGVLTPNPHAFQLWSGVPSPMTAAGIEYGHLVARSDGRGPQPPPGSKLVLAVPPWSLWELPHPARWQELSDRDRLIYPMDW